MAPRPKTYGARRSHVKQAGELVNGATADEGERSPRKTDLGPMRTSNGKEKNLEAAPKETKQNILSPGLMKEDPLSSRTTVRDCAAPEHEKESNGKVTTVSPVPRSLRKRKMSAQEMLPPDTPAKDHGSRRKSLRTSSETPQNQDPIAGNGFQSTPVDHASPSYAKVNVGSNGNTEDRQVSSVDHRIDLNDRPRDLNTLNIWVAQLVRRCHQAMNPVSAKSEQRQIDSRPQTEQDKEVTDALENVEDVRMTRGKERKRLQQLKWKELANDHGLSGNFLTESGKPPGLKDMERLLNDNLNDQLKQRLFASSNTTDVSPNVIERNACGILLFNTIVDVNNSNRTSAALLNSALNKRKDDAPFLSALRTLASSSEVMAFIYLYGHFYPIENIAWDRPTFSVSPLHPAPPARPAAHPPSEMESSNASTITEPSGPPNHAGTTASNAGGVLETTEPHQAIDDKNSEKQKPSQEVIQALEAASIILVQIQQGEAGTNYVTPYASGSVFTNPFGQHNLASYGNAYGPPFLNAPTHGAAYGPPVGPNLKNYASPFVSHLVPPPNSYASPYPNPVNLPPANYSSPYADPLVPNSTGPVVSGNHEVSRHDSDEIRHDIKKAPISTPDVPGPKGIKGNGDAAAQHISKHKEATRMSSKRSDGLSISDDKKDERKAYDEATRQGISNGKKMADNVADLDETNSGESKHQERFDAGAGKSSDDDSTDDDLPVMKLDNKNVTPPAEDHKLFTGERLGDFSSVEKIDWLLTMGNGGKIPAPRKKRTTRSPSTSAPSEADREIQTEVNKIIDGIMLYKGWAGHPGLTPKQLFYASVEGQQLASELKRLTSIAKPVLNTIVPRAESQARLRFYQQLESRAIKEKRDRETQGGFNPFHGPPVQVQHWIPPVTAAAFPFPMPPPVPSNGPIEVPFVRRGNVIAAPPGGRNIEEEKKAETYGYPPTPGSRPGASQKGQKRKRSGQH